MMRRRRQQQQQHRLLLLLMVVVIILITKLGLITEFWNPTFRRTLLLNNSRSSKHILHRDGVDFSHWTSFDDESYHRSHSDSHSHSQLWKFQSSKHFLYLHRPTKVSTAGLNNQLQCIHLAANLALKYNRTLLLSDKAFQADKIRFHRTLDFGDVFDDDLESLPIRVKLVNSSTRTNSGTTLTNTADPFEDPSSPYCNCLDDTQRIEKYHRPDDSTQQRSPLGYEYEKNHTMTKTTTCVSFHCGWGQLHLSAPKQRFPYVDANLLPLNPSYVRIADRILSTMVQKTKKTTGQSQEHRRRNMSCIDDEDNHDVNLSLGSPSTTTINVLAIHIRGGDSCGYPVMECTKTPSYPYLAVSKNINKGTRWGAFCSRTSLENNNTTERTQEHVEEEKDRLTWERFLLHFITCDGQLPYLCIDDYDAVYIATNDDRYKSSSAIRKMLNTTTTTTVNATATQLTKICFLQDFDFVEEELKRSFIFPKIDDTGGIDNNEKKDGVKSKRRSRLRLHPLHYFLLEEAILSRARKFQSSVPSSCMVYHYRQETGYQYDVDMYSVWDAITMELLASQSKDGS
mmetsp:Transcript_53963/g.131035  ORF Transcript_53963/g.131035 Transcript_53963/m.131035 type:complete len:569 (+) Transcript_53963:293-1999(+)